MLADVSEPAASEVVMGRSRMFDHEDPAGGQNPSPRTTIVGGRPPENRSDLPPVPTGIQRLLRLAREDARFRTLFLTQRGEVAAAADIELTASENAILAAVPVRQLEAMIDRVPPPSPDRREFLRQSAASAVVLLGGATLAEAVSGCGKQQTATPGPASTTTPAPGPFAEPPPEEEPHRPDHNDMQSEGGAAPDEPPEPEPPPPPRPDHNHMAPGGSRPDYDAGRPNPTRGIRPDIPPERPEHPDTIRMGGIAPDMPPEGNGD